LQGVKLPSTDEEWAHAFALYKETPEYLKINKSMTVEEFKSIYFWEWFHRMWGRSLGFMFALPAIYFVARKDTRAVIMKGGYIPRLVALFCLGGTQGLIGWWMVKSGLEHTHVLGFDRPETDMPRVSPYRLATHLSFAFVTYGLLAWTALDFFTNKVEIKAAAERLAKAGPAVLQRVARLRQFAIASMAIVGVTVFSGAFVAGNLAGLMYVPSSPLTALFHCLSPPTSLHHPTLPPSSPTTPLYLLPPFDGGTATMQLNDMLAAEYRPVAYSATPTSRRHSYNNRYSDWPFMAGKFVPDGIGEQWEEFSPRFRNVFENIALVQFDHRMLVMCLALDGILCARGCCRIGLRQLGLKPTLTR
jgi:heme A synthase